MLASHSYTKSSVQNLILAGLLAILSVLAIVSLSLGAFPIPLAQVGEVILNGLGFPGIEVDHQQVNVLFQIRLPRIILATVIGGGLGVAGAALQGMFRNPLVEPGLIGVSSGSALFAVLYLVVISGAAGFWKTLSAVGLPLFAFIGGLLHVLAVYRLSRSQGKTETATLILAGVAINALAGALIGLTLFYADDAALRSFTFWSLGDLGGASWSKIPAAVLLILFPSMLLFKDHKILNALALGEHEAFHMGVNVKQIKLKLLIITALIVGVGVSLVGMIGFIGLIVPHLIRICFGADHRMVLPGAFLLGSILMNVADLIARMIVMPAEMPIGVVSALIGAPFFIWLIFNLNTSKR